MCWHKWSKWETIERGKCIQGDETVKFTYFYDENKTINFYETQRRECSKCGMCQIAVR